MVAKTTIRGFKTGENSHEKTWKWLRKKNFYRETESLLIAAKIIAIKTNYIKARLNNTRQNSKSNSYGDRDEKIIHMITECS